MDEKSREEARTSWTWYVAPGLPAAARILSSCVADLEPFFQESWIRFCAVGFGQKTRELDAFDDQKQIAGLLDETLPSARRQIGPVQVHTWASLSCLRALERGYLLELSTIERLLEAMRIHPHTSNSVRLSGRAELRGRTAAVPKTGLSELLKDCAVGGNHHATD